MGCDALPIGGRGKAWLLKAARRDADGVFTPAKQGLRCRTGSGTSLCKSQESAANTSEQHKVEEVKRATEAVKVSFADLLTPPTDHLRVLDASMTIEPSQRVTTGGRLAQPAHPP